MAALYWLTFIDWHKLGKMAEYDGSKTNIVKHKIHYDDANNSVTG